MVRHNTIPLTSLKIGNRSWEPNPTFKSFSLSAGIMHYEVARSTDRKSGPMPWMEHEPHRLTRGLIAIQAFHHGPFDSKAENVAVRYAAKQHGADADRISSTTIYVDSDGMLFTLKEGSLQATTFDAAVKLVLFRACSSLHTDAVTSATECAALGCRGSNYPTFKKASNARTVGLGKNKLPRSIHVSLPANITGLSLTSILDNDRIKAPRGYHKQQKARQMKRFADLALMSCCPLEVLSALSEGAS